MPETNSHTRRIDYQIFEDYFVEFKTKELMDLCNKELENSPNDATILIYKAMCHTRFHQNEEALQAVELSLKNNDNNPFVLARISRVYFYLNRYTEAEKTFGLIDKQLIQSDYFFLIVEGIIYFAKNDYTNAEKSFKKSLSKQKSSDVYNLLGIVNTKISKNNLALYYFNKSVEVSPNYPSPYFNAGLIYFNMGLYESAIRKFNKYIEIAIDVSHAYNRIGLCYELMKNHQEALIAYKKAIDYANVPNPVFFINYAETMRELNFDLQQVIDVAYDARKFLADNHSQSLKKRINDFIDDVTAIIESKNNIDPTVDLIMKETTSNDVFLNTL